MKIKFYNTLKHKIEEFKPIKDRQVGMYTCGPTVYYYPHIGNFCAYIRADVLKRVLNYFGYKVKHVINITDVGHLTSDADTGEDKLEKGAKREGKTAKEIARFYEDYFKKQLPKLNIIKPDVYCRATEHIKEMVMMVILLERKGYIYRTSDGLYFDTSKFKKYGDMANLKSQKLLAGARVEFSKEKKNIHDFSVWKFEEKGQKRQMVWETPWGKRTFPGWHIECSAMSIKYLGDRFDIHTGGIDHIPVHHTNEIAQNDAAVGRKVVNYWFHNEHLLVENNKMSKSKGTCFTIDDIQTKGFEPLAFRYLLLTSGYRHKINFTWKSLKSAQESLNSLRSHLASFKGKTEGKVLDKYDKEFKGVLANNLDSAKALALTWKLIKSDEKPEDKYKTIIQFDKVFGLNLDEVKKVNIPKNVQEIVHKMDKSRKEKDWNKADMYREKLEKLGYKVRNTDKGSVIEKK